MIVPLIFIVTVIHCACRDAGVQMLLIEKTVDLTHIFHIVELVYVTTCTLVRYVMSSLANVMRLAGAVMDQLNTTVRLERDVVSFLVGSVCVIPCGLGANVQYIGVNVNPVVRNVKDLSQTSALNVLLDHL